MTDSLLVNAQWFEIVWAAISLLGVLLSGSLLWTVIADRRALPDASPLVKMHGRHRIEAESLRLSVQVLSLLFAVSLMDSPPSPPSRPTHLPVYLIVQLTGIPPGVFCFMTMSILMVFWSVRAHQWRQEIVRLS